jgi:hypothetical protein
MAAARSKPGMELERLDAEVDKAADRARAAKQQVRAAKAALKRARKLAKQLKKAAKQARKKAGAARLSAATTPLPKAPKVLPRPVKRSRVASRAPAANSKRSAAAVAKSVIQALDDQRLDEQDQIPPKP